MQSQPQPASLTPQPTEPVVTVPITTPTPVSTPAPVPAVVPPTPSQVPVENVSPIIPTPMTTNTPTQPNPQSIPPPITPKVKKPLPILTIILLLFITTSLAGGVYYYRNYIQVNPKTDQLTTDSAPETYLQTKQSSAPSPLVTPTPTPTPASTTEVSGSLETKTIENEINQTDLGKFEEDLNQLDTTAQEL
jgi:hypothetical protein